VVLSSVSALVPAHPEHHNNGVKLRRTCSSYHLIFSSPIGYDKCMAIIECLAALDVLNEDYVNIRRFRGDMTLRVTCRVESRRVVMQPRPVMLLWNYTQKFKVDVMWPYFEALKAGAEITRSVLEV